MHVGNKMSVDALDRAQQHELAKGSLLTLDNQVDTTTGTVKLKAIFPNQDLTLFPSQFVNARLLVDTQRNAALVPTAAIQRNAQGTFVYVIKSDETAAMQTVTVGTTDGSVAAVQGVQPGDVIATSGFDKLQDGVKVKISNGAGGSNPSADNGSKNGGNPGSSSKASGSGTTGSGSSNGSGGNRP
jgi:multidrug efflux system membrane fusion protein